MNTISCKNSLSLIQSDYFNECLKRVLFRTKKIWEIKVNIFDLVWDVIDLEKHSEKTKLMFFNSDDFKNHYEAIRLKEWNKINYVEIFEKIKSWSILSETERLALICFMRDPIVMNAVKREISNFRDNLNLDSIDENEYEFDICGLLWFEWQDGYSSLVNCVESVSNQIYQIMYVEWRYLQSA